MSTDEYKKKRKFHKTPEPSPDDPKAKVRRKKVGERDIRPLTFVVHEHHASHLHFDLRLELDGVLKSWAVPKGPPKSHNEKRLAVHVEDHPLSYASFEGTIPPGNYGAGEVFIWDSGAYSSADTASRKESEDILRKEYEKGHMRLLFAGEKLRGLYALVKTKENQWLFILKQKIGSSPMPRDISPMLAKQSEKPFDGPEWIFENKWDGYRIIAYVSNGGENVRLATRKGQDYALRFEEIANELKKLGSHDCILDGEAIAVNEKGMDDFQRLQDHGINKAKLRYALFDILYLDGEDLRSFPLIERKKILKEFLDSSLEDDSTIFYSDHIETDGIKAFQKAKKEGREGIIAKRIESSYESARSGSWQKIRSEKRQEVVIAGYTAPKGGRMHFGSLILGAYDENGSFRHIGNVGSGFDDRSLSALASAFSKINMKDSPLQGYDSPKNANARQTWVKPLLVCEVRFTEWTKDGKLRHPVFLSLRGDKDPKDAVIINESSQSKEGVFSPLEGSTDERAAITNPDKVFWPKEGYIKKDLIHYYEKISPFILPFLKDRPMTLVRHPNGIGEESFYQKNFEADAPTFLKTVSLRSESKGSIRYVVCNNKASLLYIANLGCIEMNPWNSKYDAPDTPDYMIIDLDPVDESFESVIETARSAKKILDAACPHSFIKTSGKRGLHILIPLEPRYSYDDIRIFSRLLVDMIHEKIPDMTSLERSPSKRRGKVYLDYLQNRRGQTLAAPYSVRPWPKATVSTPLEWKEVKKGLDPSKFTIRSIWKRLESKGDLWKDFFSNRLRLEDAIARLQKTSYKA